LKNGRLCLPWTPTNLEGAGKLRLDVASDYESSELFNE
jgi:hypothetical protein